MKMESIRNIGYPRNMIADALKIPADEIPYDDVEETAEYLLYQLGSIEQDIILSRYRDGLSLGKIAAKYNSYANSISNKIKSIFKKMAIGVNGFYLTRGCHKLETEPVVTAETKLSELPIPLDLRKEINRVIESAVVCSSLSLPNEIYFNADTSINPDISSININDYENLLIVEDIIQLLHMHAFNQSDTIKIIKFMELWGFTDDDIYGEDQLESVRWTAISNTDVESVDAKDKFPWNLIKNVVGIRYTQDWFLFPKYSSVYELIGTIYHVLGTIPERDAKILLMLYRDGMTRAEAAHVLSVTSQRVADMEKVALRKLWQAPRFNMLMKGYDVYTDELWEKRESRCRQTIDACKAYINNIYRAYNSCVKNDIDVDIPNDLLAPIKLSPIKIEDLDINTRTYNCLARAGKRTVGDCIDAFRTQDIWKIQNMGIDSIRNIYKALISMGITDRDLFDCDSEAKLYILHKK